MDLKVPKFKFQLNLVFIEVSKVDLDFYFSFLIRMIGGVKCNNE